MVNYPLSSIEDRAIRWALRIAPPVAIAIVVLLGTISVAAAQL